MIEDYFRQIATLIATAGLIHSSSITYDKRSASIGFIRGDISFLDGSQLHLREFVNVERGTEKGSKLAFHAHFRGDDYSARARCCSL